MDIFSIIILFFVISAVVNLIKRFQQPAKKAQNQTMTQEQIEATQRKSVPKPAPKPADFRFPSVQKPAPAPVFQEGGDPNAMRREYTPISSSRDLESQFSEYEGSLDVTSTEGVGYESDAYDPIEPQYQAEQAADLQVLPESFNRNALLQAVVMSEVLKRPGVRR